MELYKGATAMGAAHAIPVVQDKGTFDVILKTVKSTQPSFGQIMV